MDGKRRKYIITIIGCFLLFFCTGRVQAAGSTKLVTGIANYNYASQVLRQVNEERNKQGLTSLVMDEELLDAAMLRAAECAVSFSHFRPNGTLCFTACTKMYGENIAYGYTTSKIVMDAWMNSDGHKENILNGMYSSIGIGCFEYNGRLYWTQCFGLEGEKIEEIPENAEKTYQVALDTSTTTKLVKNTGLAKVSGFKVTAGKQKLTLQWKKAKSISGYQIQLSTNKTFKTSQTYTINSRITKKVLNKYRGTKLKAKKKYYLRIRSYKKGANTKIYSKWVKISKKTK